MTNTVKEARLSADLTQNELAIQAAVSRHSILRMEQLCYPAPLPNVIGTLSDITGVSERKLTDGYLEDVRLNREDTGEVWFADGASVAYAYAVAIVEDYTPLNPDHRRRKHEHPFTQWRVAMAELTNEHDSGIHFSMLFSIHPATVNRYESFKTGFPPGIAVAFEAAGLLDSPKGKKLMALFKHHKLFNTVGD